MAVRYETIVGCGKNEQERSFWACIDRHALAAVAVSSSICPRCRMLQPRHAQTSAKWACCEGYMVEALMHLCFLYTADCRPWDIEARRRDIEAHRRTMCCGVASQEGGEPAQSLPVQCASNNAERVGRGWHRHECYIIPKCVESLTSLCRDRYMSLLVRLLEGERGSHACADSQEGIA